MVTTACTGHSMLDGTLISPEYSDDPSNTSSPQLLPLQDPHSSKEWGMCLFHGWLNQLGLSETLHITSLPTAPPPLFTNHKVMKLCTSARIPWPESLNGGPQPNGGLQTYRPQEQL